MDLVQHFKTHWQKNFNQLSIANCHLILAVSGGLDSVVLLDLIAKNGFNFSIAQCNFQLRGEESIRDEMFVKQLAEQYNVPFFVIRFNANDYAIQHKIGIQEAARNLRYDWFRQLVDSIKLTDDSEQTPAIFIATAHHADDNIETVLMNIFRGTGIQGLTGIPAFDKKNKIIRPLLFATRNEIELYAKKNNLKWVEDSSNLKDDYTRNFFRHKIIPLVTEKFSNANNNFLTNIERWKDAEKLYTQSVQKNIKKLLVKNGSEFQIPILLLKKTDAANTLLWEMIKAFHFTALQVDEVMKLLDAANGSYIASSTHRIFKNRQWLVIATLETTIAKQILIEATNSSVQTPIGVFQTKILSSFSIENNNNIALLNASTVSFPLIFRKYKQGDYFYPLGMKKKKKISRFLIDLKLSKTAKENVWVVEMNKKIIWLVGYRIDDRFKVEPSTKQALQLTIKS